MKLFTKSEMQALEAAAQKSGLTLERMMDNAGTALAKEAQARWGPLSGRPIVILCGKGNNGGDGMVCATRLTEWGASCTVLLLEGLPKTDLAKNAYAQLPRQVQVLDPARKPRVAEAALSQADVVVDCVYGFGFRGELELTAARWLELANSLPCQRLSADLPSGTECDTGRAAEGAFRAHVTVTFTAEKLASRCYPAREYCGETVIRPVGITQVQVQGAATHASLTGPELVRPLLAPPPVQANKGDLGRLLLVCGSYGMAGACVMAACAALRCGVGLVNIAADAYIYPILASAVPEAVFIVLNTADPVDTEARLSAALDACSACVVGCGLGGLSDLLCPIVLAHRDKPLLLDADALNFCARRDYVPEPSDCPLVLTPHPGEAARLTGRSVKEVQSDRIHTAQSLAERFGGTVLLKGAGTVIASLDGQLFLNPTGNPGMAKGGSGDVLAGIIGAFLAQGVPGPTAAAAGAYLHGLAGDLCRERLSARAMLPTDLAEALPEIIKKFESE